jgi:hypothetical protein
MVRRLTSSITATVATTLGVALFATAPSASALTPVYSGPLAHFNGNYVNIRNQPKTNSTAIEGQGQKGQAFCFNGLGYGSGGDWAYGTDQPTNRTGYVYGSYLTYRRGDQCEVL